MIERRQMKKGKPQNGKKHTLGSAEIIFCSNDMETGARKSNFAGLSLNENERADAINNF